MNHYTAEPVAPAPDGARTCPSCGSKRLEAAQVRDRFSYGAGAKAVELSADIPVERCLDCGLEFSGEEAEQLRHEAVCRHLQVLTPREIGAIRERYGMSRAKFAEVTLIGTATLARWEAGEIIQNPAMDAYMRLIARAELFDMVRSGSLNQQNHAVRAEPPRVAAGSVAVGVEPFECIRRRDSSQRKALRDRQHGFKLVSSAA